MERQICIECPSEILVTLHSSDEAFAEWMKVQAATILFREGRISSGMAARWLGMSRSAFLLRAMDSGAELLEDTRADFDRETSLL